MSDYADFVGEMLRKGLAHVLRGPRGVMPKQTRRMTRQNSQGREERQHAKNRIHQDVEI